MVLSSDKLACTQGVVSVSANPRKKWDCGFEHLQC